MRRCEEDSRLVGRRGESGLRGYFDTAEDLADFMWWIEEGGYLEVVI